MGGRRKRFAFAVLAAQPRWAFAVALFVALAGCRATKWNAPTLAMALDPEACGTVKQAEGSPLPAVMLDAERAYLAAAEAEDSRQARCVDCYFQAAVASWTCLHAEGAISAEASAASRAWSLYHSSLAKLLDTGQRFGRLDPQRHLEVFTPAGRLVVPVSFHGFTRPPEDFNQLRLVGPYQTTELTHTFAQHGLGVPLVVARLRAAEERFHNRQQVFAATAVLTHELAVDDFASPPACEPRFRLAFHDPLRVNCMEIDGRPIPLAADISAPFAAILATGQRSWWQDFLQRRPPEGNGKLIMVGPYQPGKIPVVFIHGLLSDPITWVNLANEIQANPELRERYQLWAFKYATGAAFLAPAAVLRRELAAAVQWHDPANADPALRRMVLVGHSMGGLIAKLQVTHSDTALWDAIASRPFETVAATEYQSRELATAFFFEPSNCVERVVFIGTPHQGASTARRAIGRFGASLVRSGGREADQYADFVANNPCLIVPEYVDRLPTSIDLLEPDSPLLLALQQLRIRPDVCLHSIIGTGGCCLHAPSDGVVNVTSARHPCVESEAYVDERHESLPSNAETAKELIRILQLHLQS